MALLPDSLNEVGRRRAAAVSIFLLMLVLLTAMAAFLTVSEYGEPREDDEGDGAVPIDATPATDPGENGETRDDGPSDTQETADDGTRSSEDDLERDEAEPVRGGPEEPDSAEGDAERISSTTLTELDVRAVVDESNTGSNRSPVFNQFDGGLYIVRATNYGNRMEAGLVDSDGVSRTTLKVIGETESVVAIGLQRGGYKIWVDANDRWELEFFRPKKTPVVSSPSLQESGAQSKVYGPLRGGGRTYDLRFENEAGDHAEVYGIDEDGDVFEVFLDQAGLSEIETNYSHTDPHYLTVKTTSEDWTITLRAR